MKLEYYREIDIPLTERTLPHLVRRQAIQHGDRVFLSFEGQHYTFRDVDRLSTRLAHGLRNFGVGKGSHVAFIIDNRPEVVWLYLAIAKLGALAVPINTAAKGEQLSYFIHFFDVTTLICEGVYLERFLAVRGTTPNVERIAILDPVDGVTTPEGISAARFEALLTDNEEDLHVEVSFSDAAQISYTSGTTGPSKGNVATQCSLITSAMGYAQAFGYVESDVLYICLPLFHSNAYVGSCLAALVSGASVALARRFSMSRFWDDIRESGATQFNALGAMTNIIWNHPPSPRDKDHKVRLSFVVPMPSFAREFAERFNLQITSTYALTDFGTIALLRPDRPEDKWLSAGQVRPEMTVAVLDDNDISCPPGGIGEICVRAELPFISTQGYYKMPEQTLRSRRNLWFHTGDQGYVDADGYIFFSDRISDSIRRRGESISAYEIEQILLQHPLVEDVAAFGVKSEISGQEVMISVVAKKGQAIDPAEVIEFCRTRMAYYMVPRYIAVMDVLPKTSTQKVEKFKLKKAAEADLETVWDREKHGIVVSR